jgi:glycosyltransferase involved in cell wall biosynthesis
MRIAILNWSSRVVGGIESYLGRLIPVLVQAGHEVAFLSEVDEPLDRGRLTLPPAVQSWCVSTLGAGNALQALRDWHPDVLYAHKLKSPEFEAETLAIAPAVFFAHDYQGMCISGTKTHQFPIATPCDRRFGAACLLHYFPHRCGGLNPVTMLKLYGSQSRRLELLRRYDAIITHSDHMLEELIRNGVIRERAHSFPFLVEGQRSRPSDRQPGSSLGGDSSAENESEGIETKSTVQLMFSGRMEQLKGGHILLDALPEVQRALGKKVRVVFAGDGRKRTEWELQAEHLRRQHSALEIEFVGWLDQSQLDLLLDQSDLMVVPSLWPEPFGMTGPEAGLRGVPVAAFAVGGIREWLQDGVNGYLAPGDPPTVKGLAEAIIRCLRSEETYGHLQSGTVRLAGRFNVDSHLTNLMGVFNRVVSTAALRADSWGD